MHIGTVIKHSVNIHVTHITRQMAQGMLEHASALLKCSQGGMVLNTAFIERFNGTMRERLASLTRKCRHPARRLFSLHTGMYLIGCTYNWCWPHHELSRTATDASGRRSWVACTPAMASGLTEHVWSVFELLSYKVAPSPWTAPKRRGHPRSRPVLDSTVPKRPRGRPRKRAVPDPTVPKRPRGRPRKEALCSTTS